MRNLSLKGKILLLSGFMIAMTATVGGVSYWSSTTVSEDFKLVVEEDVPATQAVNQMLLSWRLARIKLLELVSPGATPQMTREAVKTIGEQWDIYNANEKIVASIIDSDEGKSAFEEFKKAKVEASDAFDKALALFSANPDENSTERKEMQRIVLRDIGGPIGDRVRDASAKLAQYAEQKIRKHTAHAQASSGTGNTLILVSFVLGSLASFVLAFFFAHRVSAKMQLIISSISESTSSVSSASTQIASASQSLSQAVTEQAASLQETAASLEEISAMIGKSSDSASDTERKAQDSQAKASEGQGAVTQMMDSMNDISQSNDTIMHQIDHSNQQMTEIVKLIQNIGAKTKVINDIVFQTKLLSFNASVEAARAGEHGKGFAVVAEEVGNLAQMSGNAAKEIADMLDSSTSKVESIVNETKTKVSHLISNGKQKVDAGVSVAQRCSDVLGEIVDNVSQVTSLAKEISLASKEQTQGVGEINKAMSELDAVTQQNSAASHQTAAAAASLTTQATALENAVSELQLTVMGGHAQNADLYHSERSSSKVVKLHDRRPGRSDKLAS